MPPCLLLLLNKRLRAATILTYHTTLLLSLHPFILDGGGAGLFAFIGVIGSVVFFYGGVGHIYGGLINGYVDAIDVIES